MSAVFARKTRLRRRMFLRTMVLTLNYAVQGRGSEVHPCALNDRDRVQEILGAVCSAWRVSHLQHLSSFWLVCNITTLNRRAKR